MGVCVYFPIPDNAPKANWNWHKIRVITKPAWVGTELKTSVTVWSNSTLCSECLLSAYGTLPQMLPSSPLPPVPRLAFSEHLF